jgi:lysophospholipase L1-like esterase
VKDYRGGHDVGFMLKCSYGNGYRFTNDPHYREVLIQGARSLSTRFKPEVGLIRSWDHKGLEYPVIIDSMMNLELLTWSAREANEPRLRDIAIQHADNTLKNHFREDASSWHVVEYNPTNGVVVKKQTHQGVGDSSAWARGQAWALYGYTMMFRETRKSEYLAQAGKVARFLMNHPRLPEDKIPYWDFDAPNIPDAPRDASAAAIMASALIELSENVEPGFGRQCFQLARQQLLSLSSPSYLAKLGENGGFLLRHCVGNMPKNSEVDVPLNYADYYFLEGLFRYRNHMEQGKALSIAPRASSSKDSLAATAEPGSRAEKKPSDLRFQPDPLLPNVLLIGDSISIGYTRAVRDLLNGKANVFRAINGNGVAANCSDTSKGVAELDRWLAIAPKWDVIHFNWGLHDLKRMTPGASTPTPSGNPDDPPLHSVKVYCENLENIVARLQQTGAWLVFATTTPVPEGVKSPFRAPSDPVRYNMAASEVMKNHGVQVNDLYTFIQPRLAELQLPQNVHFTSKGSGALAEQVARAITTELAKKRTEGKTGPPMSQNGKSILR